MKIKRTMIGVVVLVAICCLWNLQVGAYGLFTADPPESSRCSQCHTDWPGATHTVHTAAFDCSNCHMDNNPVATSSCSACHPAGAMLEGHSLLEGPGDMAYCGYCHAGVNAESRNWGEVKALFR